MIMETNRGDASLAQGDDIVEQYNAFKFGNFITKEAYQELVSQQISLYDNPQIRFLMRNLAWKLGHPLAIHDLQEHMPDWLEDERRQQSLTGELLRENIKTTRDTVTGLEVLYIPKDDNLIGGRSLVRVRATTAKGYKPTVRSLDPGGIDRLQGNPRVAMAESYYNRLIGSEIALGPVWHPGNKGFHYLRADPKSFPEDLRGDYAAIKSWHQAQPKKK